MNRNSVADEPQHLRLAAAALADDDLHGALYLCHKAVASGVDQPDVLGRATALLRTQSRPGPVIELALGRWVPDRHGPGAGLDLLTALIADQRIDDAERVLHELYLLASDPADLEAGRRRTVLRAHEFALDGLRVARCVPVLSTVQTRDYRDQVLPTPVWKHPDLDLPQADGPRVAVVPLAFSPERPEYRAFARGMAPWLAATLRTCTDADVSCHLMINERGPVADHYRRHNYEMMLDLTGLAGQRAFLIGGAVLALGDRPAIDLDVWRPDGTRFRVNQHFVRWGSDGFRKLVPRVAAVCGLTRRPGAPSLPPSGLLKELVPAYADVLPPLLAQRGALNPGLVDGRRERVDRLFDLIEAYPQEGEPRLLAFGLLAGLARSGSPIPAEYRHRVRALVPVDEPTAALTAMTRIVEALYA